MSTTWAHSFQKSLLYHSQPLSSCHQDEISPKKKSPFMMAYLRQVNLPHSTSDNQLCPIHQKCSLSLIACIFYAQEFQVVFGEQTFCKCQFLEQMWRMQQWVFYRSSRKTSGSLLLYKKCFKKTLKYLAKSSWIPNNTRRDCIMNKNQHLNPFLMHTSIKYWQCLINLHPDVVWHWFKLHFSRLHFW